MIDSCIRSVEDQKNTPCKLYMSDLGNLVQCLDESGHHMEVNDKVKGMFDSQV